MMKGFDKGGGIREEGRKEQGRDTWLALTTSYCIITL